MNELFRFLKVFIHFNDLRDETGEEQCEYEVGEDAIEVQSDEKVDTECTEKETIVIDYFFHDSGYSLIFLKDKTRL